MSNRQFVTFGLMAGLLICSIDLRGQSTGVVRETLSNGLRVVIVHDPLAPVVSTVINYRVGSNEAPQGFPGMARMGGEFDADTQQMVTQYFFTTPAEDLDLALHIESIRMQVRGIPRHTL